MENGQTSTQQATGQNSIPYLNKEHGYFGSASVTKSPAEIFAFCQDEQNIPAVTSRKKSD